VRGERLAVVAAVHRVLDVPLRGQHERGDLGARGEVLEVLRGQAVQPAEPVRPTDPDDAAVGEVDEAFALLEGALFPVERAVVRRDRGVDAVAGDGAGQVEERASVVSHRVLIIAR